MICYLAYPIDAAGDDPILRTQLAIVRRDLQGVPGLCTYDPQPAWLISDRPKMDPRLQVVNNAAIDACDFMVALLPSHVSSIGVPLEIDWAARLGRPVFVLRDKPSFGLASMGPSVHQFAKMSALCAAVEEHFSEVEFSVEPGSIQDEVLRLADDLWTMESTARPLVARVESMHDYPITHAHPDDAGWDLHYTGDERLEVPVGQVVSVPCGVKIEWPPHVWGMIIGRSSSFQNRNLLVNISVIDPGFRGEMFALVRNIGTEPVTIHPWERVAQIVPLPALAPNIVVEYGPVGPGSRGENGFGSSGL